MKLCIDCKWCHYPFMLNGAPVLISYEAQCAHPDVDLPVGEHALKRRYVVGGAVDRDCQSIRMYGVKCGPEAKLFEPKVGGFI